MLDAYDTILERVKPGTQLKTPDAKVGAPFVVEVLDAEGLTVKTARGGKIRISLFTFETAVKFLADQNIRGGTWLEVKDQDFQMLLNMENDKVRAASYILSILAAAGLIEVDGGRPNKVRLV
ncbi:MAG: hypothetical protein K8T90_13760 [Planctomycetes bacterium]|nr:hypothetical protein [Planctomycetota bacterium]